MRAHLLSLLAVAAAVPAWAAELNLITGVEVKDAGAEVVLSVKCSQRPSFTTFSMADPPRFVIDFSESKFQGVPAELPGSGGVVQSIKNLSYGSDASAIARVMVAFGTEVNPPSVEEAGEALVIRIAKPGAPAVAAAEPTAAPAADARADAEAQARAEAAAAKARAEEDARAQAQALAAAKAKAEEDARAQAQALAAAKAKADADARAQADAAAAAKARAEEDARAQAQALAAAKAKADADARAQADAAVAAKAKAEEDARAQAQALAAAKAKADADARAQADAAAAARAKAEEDARAKVASAAPAAEPAAPTDAEQRELEAEIAAARAEAESAPRATATAAKAAQVEKLAPAGAPALVREVGFRQLPEASRIYVRTSAAPQFTVQEVDERTVRIEVENARATRRNDLRFLDTSFFSSAVQLITPSRQGSSYVLTVKLRERVPYQQTVEGDMLAVDFQRPPSGGAGAQPSQAPAAAESAPAEGQAE